MDAFSPFHVCFNVRSVLSCVFLDFWQSSSVGRAYVYVKFIITYDMKYYSTLFDTWARALDAAKPARVDAIFLDWSKAFDRVDHSILLQKLHKYGICSNMWMWINNFLSRCKQQVIFSGAKSDWVPVTSGVPQGSVLGPVLFNLFTSELPNYVKSSLPQYADDTVLYRIIRSANDTVILQNDLDIISKWYTDNWMQLNSNKCTIMHVTRSRSQIPTTNLLQGSHPLEVVDSYKYLGVIFSKDLSWSKHVQMVRSRRSKLAGFIRRIVKSRNP